MSEALNSCSLCGAILTPSKTCRQMSEELYAYTLTRGRDEFIHQHAVDAYAAQHVSADSKPIFAAAALIGLYLFCERGYTGRRVQEVHMQLGNKMKTWPRFEPPRRGTTLTVMHPLRAPAGSQRDATIKEWARAVWETWQEQHAEVARLLSEAEI